MDSQIIQKYKKYTTAQLRQKAGEKFRAFIRKRDEGQPCISCGSRNTSDASHYYSAGHFPNLEFNEDNCHAACRRCNFFLSGNLIHYRERLIQKIGLARVEALDFQAKAYKRNGYKHDRFFLIETIERYK